MYVSRPLLNTIQSFYVFTPPCKDAPGTLEGTSSDSAVTDEAKPKKLTILIDNLQFFNFSDFVLKIVD